MTLRALIIALLASLLALHDYIDWHHSTLRAILAITWTVYAVLWLNVWWRERG